MPRAIHPVWAWRSLLGMNAASLLRWSRRTRGFHRFSKQLRRVCERSLSGHNVPVRYQGGLIWLDIGHWLENRIFVNGMYESGTVGFIQRAVQHGYSFVDIGAHIGTHVIAAATQRATPAQRFVAFEASPDALELLRWNIRWNRLQDTVSIHDVALADRSGELSFFVTDGANPGANGLLRRSVDQASIRVPARRLDDIFDVNSFSTPVLLKIDVEGAEPLVLAGATAFLSNVRDLVLVLEHESQNLLDDSYTAFTVRDTLAAHGFQFWKIDEHQGVLTAFEPRIETSCNFVAARSLPGFATPVPQRS